MQRALEDPSKSFSALVGAAPADLSPEDAAAIADAVALTKATNLPALDLGAFNAGAGAPAARARPDDPATLQRVKAAVALSRK